MSAFKPNQLFKDELSTADTRKVLNIMEPEINQEELEKSRGLRKI